MLNERGMIKWRPFDNFGSSETMIKEINKERNIITMPSLSEEEINEFNDKIIYYYETKDIIDLKYFYNGYIYKLKGIISSINNKYLVISNKKIYFNQITWIK